MKRALIIALSLLTLLRVEYCFAQTDTNLIAAGDWSQAVNDQDHWLRGRLLVYDENGGGSANHAKIYLELQHVFHGAWDGPMEFYFNVGFNGVVSFELNDTHGAPVPQEQLPIIGPAPPAYWVTLPCDATIRLRADIYNLGTQSKPDGLVIFANGGRWVIHPNTTNDVFLSATLTPSKDHPSPLKYDVWQGALKLPAVKIPAHKVETHSSINEPSPSLAYRDADSGITFSVESDGRQVVATDKDGNILWRRQPGTDGNLPPYMPERPQRNPAITWIGALTTAQSKRLAGEGSGKFIGILFSSRQGGVLDEKNGDFTFEGQN
jgi:hypothetical protein